MIEAIKGMRGQEQALCKCDDCATETTVAAAHGNAGDFRKGGRSTYRRMCLKNEGRVIEKLKAQGWTLVKGRLRCPRCEDVRKKSSTQWLDAANECEDKMAKVAENVTPLRQPTPKQKREIISMLEVVYDDDAKRYKDAETDLTVAEAIGGGVMFGWVAEIREQLFGPDGGNGDMDALAEEIREWLEKADKRLSVLNTEHQAFIKQMRDANEAAQKVRDLASRLEAIRRAVGPKAQAV